MQRSEFGGDETTIANVQPKDDKALTASERLRLSYLTGHPEDPLAPRNSRAWTGETEFPPPSTD